MKLTDKERQVVSSILDSIIDDLTKEDGYPYPGGIAYNSDNAIFCFDTEDYKALKRAKTKMRQYD